MTTHSPLATKKCKDCGADAKALPPETIADLIKQIPGWDLVEGEVRRTFKFKNYYETLAFVNATAWISHHENHHPDMEVGYNKVTMRYSTHSVKGLTENDFICPAKISELLKA